MHWRSLAEISPLLLALAAASALCGEAAPLGADELKTLIAGKTIEAQNPDGTTYRVYFDPNGQRLARQGNGEYALPWYIREDGTHCVTTQTGDDCARVARNADGSHTRYRDGQVVVRWLRILPGKELGTVAATGGTPGAPTIAARQLGAQEYELRVSSPSLRTVQEAQALAVRAAGSICRSLVPVLGTYRFESIQQLGQDAAASGAANLVLTQRVTCAATAQLPPRNEAPTTYSKEEKDKAAAKVLDETERYFRLMGERKFDEALLQMDLADGIGNETSWRNAKRDFLSTAGALQRIEITKVTVYENPASASKPGLYVAADYRNIWANAPLQCGYLVWLRTSGGEFRIVREETGHVTTGQLNAMPAAQRQSVEQALRCR
jgi:YD repeat-containing protein